MSEQKSRESPGCDCGVPAQRSSQQGPEMVSVKLEDCSQTLELNVIVKEEWEESRIKEEIEVKEVDQRTVKEVEERGVKEEVEKRAVKEEHGERTVKEEHGERTVKEEADNNEVSAPDLREEEATVDSISDPGKFRCGVWREVGDLVATGDSQTIVGLLLASNVF
jgi:hypothetical protein